MRTAKLLLQYSLGQKRLKRPLDSVVLSDPVCLNKYRPKISAEVIAFVKQRISKSKNPLQAKQVQAEIQAEKKVDLSLKSVRKILRSLGVSYKKVYRAEIRFNTVLAKQKRQLSALLFAQQLAQGKIIVNIDESTLDQTCYVRRGWSATGQQEYQKNVFRLRNYNIIAACSSDGHVWFSVNCGYTNSVTFYGFLL